MENSHSRKRLILVVDDQHQNLQLVASVLNPLYNLVLTDKGEKALPYALKKRPDLILLDIMMPEISGFEVCRQIRQQPELNTVPVIFLTAKTEEEDIIHAYEAGGVDYVTKPFRTRELLARIEAHITLKEQHEAILLLNSELEAINKQKDKLLSVIAHDMRSTIGSIGNLVEVLMPDIDTMSTEDILQYLQLIKQGSEKVYAMFDDLLLWAKNQFQNVPLELTVFNLRDEAESTVGQTAVQAGNKNIRIVIDIPADTVVYADVNMVRTILRNLISNAVKFSNAGTEVTVRSITVAGTVEILVSDRGVGMKPEDIEKILKGTAGFTTYGTKGEKGTGLGLNLCNAFIQKQGGTLHIESIYGEGSTFSFTLPTPEYAFSHSIKNSDV